MSGIEGFDLPASALMFQTMLEELQSDPLKHFHATSEAQRQLFRWVNEAETWWLAGNSGGKTHGGAALGVAMARGMRELAGVKIPYLGTPNVGWVLTQSYKQQLESSQKAYQRVLGNHPHYISYVVGKGKGYAETLYIQTDKCNHGHGDMCGQCSRIVFHCEESKSSIGGRIDWAHADEPPMESTWREIRMRRQAGRPFIKFATVTPLERERWEWFKEELDGCLVYESPFLTGGEARYGESKNGRAVIRSTLYDNLALSDDDIDAFERDIAGDPFADARRRGDFVDLSGKCPFDIEVLQKRWVQRCKPPMVETVVVQAEEDTEDGRHKVPVKVEVETWWEVEKDERYILVADPSAGIKDKRHDPGGLLVVSRANPRVIARYNGYVGPYGLGSLAGLLAKRYNRAQVDVDMTGGYGGPFLTALSDCRYGNIRRDVDPDKPGQMQARLGFRISSSNRGEIVGSIQQAILEDDILIRSRDVIDCLMNVVVDETGRPAGSKARRGRFDEDMICLGRALYLLSITPRPTKRESAWETMLRENGLGKKVNIPLPVRERWE